tara:strand:- start:188 stop:361 length:174 start_codon:yes stop_codon:yes gene_type:complete
VSIGKKVAIKNDKNSNDCDKNTGKLLIGNNIPIIIDFEKSGKGNKSKPPTKPNKIDI